MNDQPEALRVAQTLESDWQVNLVLHAAPVAARLLREQHAEIEELREFHQDVFDQKMDMLEAEIEELRAAVLAEREACAKVCEDDVRTWSYPGSITRAECAYAIRARGKT